MTFEPVERIADAVLFEGYVLYPYRASAAKNRYRWQFGVVAPRAPQDDGEPWFTQTDCLVQPHDVAADDGADAPRPLQPNADASFRQTDVARSRQPSGLRLHVRVRCLRPTRTPTGKRSPKKRSSRTIVRPSSGSSSS